MDAEFPAERTLDINHGLVSIRLTRTTPGHQNQLIPFTGPTQRTAVTQNEIQSCRFDVSIVTFADVRLERIFPQRSASSQCQQPATFTDPFQQRRRDCGETIALEIIGDVERVAQPNPGHVGVWTRKWIEERIFQTIYQFVYTALCQSVLMIRKHICVQLFQCLKPLYLSKK